jgi:hypothetical protein
MQSALRLQTVVLPGGRIEVTAPELPEGDQIELIILVSEHTLTDVPGPSSRYPAVLEAEYNCLIEKKLNRTLTSDEALRLQAVRDEISAIDQNYPDVRAMQAHKLSAELAEIRAELEALPLASRSSQ